MTEQEQQLISGLAERIRNTPAQQVDRDAYDLILHTIGTRPDALYLLTQIVIMQQMALNHAQSQGSFLPGQQQAPAARQRIRSKGIRIRVMRRLRLRRAADSPDSCITRRRRRLA